MSLFTRISGRVQCRLLCVSVAIVIFLGIKKNGFKMPFESAYRTQENYNHAKNRNSDQESEEKFSMELKEELFQDALNIKQLKDKDTLFILEEKLGQSTGSDIEKDDDGVESDVNSVEAPVDSCPGIQRPSYQDIHLRNKFWQFFTYGNLTVYVFGAYLDDREFITSPGGRVIRLFPVMSAPLGQEDTMLCTTYHLLLWYNILTSPVVTRCQCVVKGEIPRWSIHHDRYGNLMIVCDIPDNGLTPSHVSLTLNKCDRPSTFIALTIPEKPLQAKPKEFGVCVKAIFGNFTRSNMTYVVSWLETLKAVGFSHVHMYYDGMTTDQVAKDGFQYYQDTGFLTFERLPNKLYESDSKYVDTGISQSVVKSVVNDCFYRNLYKFSFIAHFDIDEILIPRKHFSFKQLFRDYFSEEFDNISHVSHVVSRSAYFYNYFPPGNPSLPEHLPLLRQTYRTPVEVRMGQYYTWDTKGTGVQKSLCSTKTCIVMYIHACALGANHSTGLQMPSELLLSHHYRSTCQNVNRCEHEFRRRVNDFTIPDLFGGTIKDGVEKVLKKIGYFDNDYE